MAEAERDTQLIGDVSITVLGDSLQIASGGVGLAVGRPTKRVLAYLATHEVPTERLTIASALWPDCTEQRALANVRTALWRLDGCSQIVTKASNSLALSPAVLVDYRQALSATEPVLVSETALQLLQKDLLRSWDEDWLFPLQQGFQLTRLAALEALAAEFIDRGQTAEALSAMLSVTATHPLRESAHEIVMRAHLAAGNSAMALAQYQLCERELYGALGVFPNATLRRLAHPLTRGEFQTLS